LTRDDERAPSRKRKSPPGRRVVSTRTKRRRLRDD
jgi:hypothetical protein